MNFKKSELTRYAKELAETTKKVMEVMSLSDEISHMEISKNVRNMDEQSGEDQKLLFEIAKQFAKYCEVEMYVDLENGNVQELCGIINRVVDCCEENDWFRE